MKNFFNQLFDYNFYCNKKLIAQAEGLTNYPQHSAKLFSHILNAHHIWNKRIMGLDREFDVWQLHDKATWADIHYENQRSTFEVIRNTEDFNKRIDYETTEGRLFASDLKDILFHIINHSTHHRAQLLADLRVNDLAIEELDFVLYKR